MNGENALLTADSLDRWRYSPRGKVDKGGNVDGWRYGGEFDSEGNAKSILIESIKQC